VQALALAQPVDHAVEAILELAELGAVVDGDVGVECTVGHARNARRSDAIGLTIDAAMTSVTAEPVIKPSAT
jgi:hypothetical protein